MVGGGLKQILRCAQDDALFVHDSNSDYALNGSCADAQDTLAELADFYETETGDGEQVVLRAWLLFGNGAKGEVGKDAKRGLAEFLASALRQARSFLRAQR